MHIQLAAAAAHLSGAGNAQLGVAAVLGIATVIVLITVFKVHPFLSLILGAAMIGSVAGIEPTKTVTSFTNGVGATVGSVGLLIALGAMVGGLLGDSGGANALVSTVVGRFSGRALPWAMAGVAALVGLPLFFEIGVVLLVPIVVLVSTHTNVPLIKIGIPALAGLSVLHGLVPPHPGPLAAIAALHADLGLTLLFGIIIAIPTVVVAGPVYGSFISTKVHAVAPALLRRAGAETPVRERVVVGGGSGSDGPDEVDAPAPSTRRAPSFALAAATILLPAVLMLAGAIGALTLASTSTPRKVLDVAGTPVVALLVGVVAAMFTLGRASGMNRQSISDSLSASLPPIAGILLIVAAGGGLKQVLVDSGVGDLIASAAAGAHLSPLVLGWLVAVGIRLATGSATVATVTAAGIVVPLTAGLDHPTVALLALAVGSGSLFFSHVNDAGFWLVKEYFGMSVRETVLTWSVMETIISVSGLVGVLLLHLVV